MIRDSNTLSDIQGVILCAQMDIESSSPEYPVTNQLEELIERIELKIQKNKNAVRNNWFHLALDHARNAKKHFGEKKTKESAEELEQCWKHLEQGNKAHRRKTDIVVSPDGTAKILKNEN